MSLLAIFTLAIPTSLPSREKLYAGRQLKSTVNAYLLVEIYERICDAFDRRNLKRLLLQLWCFDAFDVLAKALFSFLASL